MNEVTRQPEITNDVPAGVAKLREDDMAARLYDNTSYHSSTIDPDEFGVGQVAQDAAREMGRIVNDMNMDGADASQFLGVIKYMRANPPTDAQNSQWQREAYKRLLNLNNNDETQVRADLALATTLIKRDPRVAELVSGAKAENHPDLVDMFVRIARSERLKGRL